MHLRSDLPVAEVGLARAGRQPGPSPEREGDAVAVRAAESKVRADTKVSEAARVARRRMGSAADDLLRAAAREDERHVQDDPDAIDERGRSARMEREHVLDDLLAVVAERREWRRVVVGDDADRRPRGASQVE
jgi:hypothetical protein